jgi:hypothetical protein
MNMNKESQSLMPAGQRQSGTQPFLIRTISRARKLQEGRRPTIQGLQGSQLQNGTLPVPRHGGYGVAFQIQTVEHRQAVQCLQACL